MMHLPATPDCSNGMQRTVALVSVLIFASYAGTEIKLDGEELMIMSEDDILAVVE